MVFNTITKEKEKTLGRVGTIGRFKPLHNGAFTLLKSLCERADEVIIGIGSSNKYNLRNPFTQEETKEMIDLALQDNFNNYSFVFIPDFGHIPQYKDGKYWRTVVVEKFGKLDYFVSANDYVKDLLKDHYNILESYFVVPREDRFRLRGAQVRYAMATGENLKNLVPKRVAEYLENNDLVKRFNKEFGLETLACVIDSDYTEDESAAEEKMHAREK